MLALRANLCLCLKGITFGLAAFAGAAVAANGDVARVALVALRMVNATVNIAFNAAYNFRIVCHTSASKPKKFKTLSVIFIMRVNF